jgi:hypothetical protein
MGAALLSVSGRRATVLRGVATLSEVVEQAPEHSKGCPDTVRGAGLPIRASEVRHQVLSGDCQRVAAGMGMCEFRQASDTGSYGPGTPLRRLLFGDKQIQPRHPCGRRRCLLRAWCLSFDSLGQPGSDGVEVTGHQHRRVGVGHGEPVATLRERRTQPASTLPGITRAIDSPGYLGFGRRPAAPFLRGLACAMASEALAMRRTLTGPLPQVLVGEFVAVAAARRRHARRPARSA